MITISEYTVMNEWFLRKVVKAQEAEANSDAIPEFNEVQWLRLNHKYIAHIERLWDFTSLTRLDLNGNFIEKIQGLDFLTNLTWLNLSFNRIAKMEGLESLQKLEMLNLTSNKISIIENLGTLENLTHFLFGHNLVQLLDNVVCLRKCKKLFAVTLAGNPISNLDNYKLFIGAYFPDLMSLDSDLIDEETRIAGAIEYASELEKMKVEELDEQKAAETEQQRAAELKLHQDAFVENLNGSGFFNSLFEGDPEKENIRCVTEVASLTQAYEEQMVEQCVQLFEIGLAERERREAEVNLLRSGQNETVKYYLERQSKLLETFHQDHRERLVELQHLTEPYMIAVKIKKGIDAINQLRKDLMTVEFQLIYQLEENIKMFGNCVSEIAANFIETILGTFVQCREMETTCSQKVREVAILTLAKVSGEIMEEELPYEVQMLFTDKDKVLDALTTSHNNHMIRINDRESKLVTSVTTWKLTVIKEAQDKELYMNRLHLSDILRYMDHLKRELEDFQ